MLITRREQGQHLYRVPLTLDIAVAKKQEDIRFVRRVSTANGYTICDPRPWDYGVTVPADTSSGGAQEYRGGD